MWQYLNGDLTEAELNVAVETNQDDLAVILIQKKNQLSALLEELSVLQRRLNLTTLYVTHDQSEATSFANSVVRMKNGRIDEIVVLDESKLDASAKGIWMTCEE